MLAGLLLFCLAVPLVWRQERGATESAQWSAQNGSLKGAKASLLSGHAEHLQFNFGGFPDVFGNSPHHLKSERDVLELWWPPTIEELIAARMGMPQSNDDPLNWYAFARTDAEGRERIARPQDAAIAMPVPGAQVTAALEWVGQAMAEYSLAEVLQRFSGSAAEVYRLWITQRVAISEPQWSESAEVARPAASSLKLVTPEDRIATLPQDGPIESSKLVRVAPQPEMDVNDTSRLPQVLLEQLYRLEQHAETASWAEQTIDRLYMFVEQEDWEAERVQTILAELSDAAQQAVAMSESTRHDRLRVELLRAHWGLARRIDRWAVEHEIQVAARARNRVASRGSLGAVFENIPGRTDPSADALALDLERYEQSRDPQIARQVVSQKRELERSPDSLDRALADAVEQHYRNANVRVAITAEMLNRFIEQEQPEVRMLRDRIAGTPVRGQSQTQSRSRVRLDPSTDSWQLEVEAHGMVESNTLADGGPATVRSRFATDFAARKRVLVNPAGGVLLQPTFIDVKSHNRLMGVTTDYDWVPLLGSYARGRATQEYRARQARARSEVESRVSTEAVAHVDRKTQEAVERVERQIRQRVTDRLAASGVKLTPVEMTTTRKRVVARLRVAGDDQIGSHTPRPRALSDSLASVQLNETALTNAAVSLELDGRRCTGAELQALFQEKFPRMTVNSANVRRDAVFQFAAEDAVQFHIENGKLDVTLGLACLEVDGKTIRNFAVHTFYVPVVHGLAAELVRDGSLGIEGRLRSSQRAVLHNVFNNVLPPERRIPIVQLDDPHDPRLAGLMITQLVLEDGWVGLAIGPATGERVAERSRSLR
jgi:hypothetical protein